MTLFNLITRRRFLLLFLLGAFSAAAPDFMGVPTTAGPLDDAKCNVEDLEQANDLQLFVILQELRNTTFFRNFLVDLDRPCPLQSWRKKHNEQEEEEEFECGGNNEEADEEAEPACHVDLSSNSNPFSSNALFSMATTGFESKAQKDTFKWQQQTDFVVKQEEPCEEQLLPDSFWIDICSPPGKTAEEKLVNLAMNPEKNTGYNGTHIWKAIYEENCLMVDDTVNKEMMCLEERVLYRLLSGLHTSTTLSIAMNYYPPSKRKGRTEYEANPDYFMEKFHDHPEHIRNLHFSYVVLLRALQKAAPVLHEFDIRTGDIVEDETAKVLLRRLLDSAILQSCSNVFSAFDESLMFQQDARFDVVTLQKNFKGVFHNVSSILDCVQCQQCKLHGKMTMLGYGTALKVLFMREDPPIMTRNEIVAFINTIAKFSESIRQVRELTHLYLEKQEQKVAKMKQTAAMPQHTTVASADGVSIDILDGAVGLIAKLGQEKLIAWEREAELVQLALQRNPELLILAKHYGNDVSKFLELASSIGFVDRKAPLSDAIIVGSGLAGLSVALNILDRGGSVVIIEKEHLLGGNSNKASSGINAYVSPDEAGADSLDLFRNDTTRSAGPSARQDLIDVLVTNSGSAVTWLRERVGVDLSLKAQLGGHSSKRTHRPSNGMAGAEIIYAMQKAVREYEETGRVKVLVDTRVSSLATDDNGAVIGVECISAETDEAYELHAPNVILATGGFAADRSSGSYLEQYRPELLKFPTTAGPFSTGDGISLATSLGAGIVDMSKVQVHPTGWVDPKDPDNTSKTLAAELMRGVGGILINKDGDRFVNELGTRAHITERMLSHDPMYEKSGEWDKSRPVPTFSLVLSSSAAEEAKKHVDLYSHKGLLTRIEGVSLLAEWMKTPKAKLVKTFQEYQDAAKAGSDAFGRITFRNLPAESLENEVFYAGTVTPVLHYCMGGITIDTEGYVLNVDGERIPGLHAAGEVTGGVHGVNRLAGNSLLECTVFGSLIGRRIPIANPVNREPKQGKGRKSNEDSLRNVSSAELQQHNTVDDCWVAIHGVVYDLTEFASEHPAGPDSIWSLAGGDGTEAFDAVHNKGLLEDFAEDRIGLLL
jgi:flavocytochrome c